MVLEVNLVYMKLFWQTIDVFDGRLTVWFGDFYGV